MNSDVTLGEGALGGRVGRRHARAVPRPGRRQLRAVAGAARRAGEPERLTSDRHYLSGCARGAGRRGRRRRRRPLVGARPSRRSSPTSSRRARPSAAGPRTLTALNDEAGRRARARRAARAPLDGGRPRDPGLAAPGRQRQASRWCSRSTAARTPCTAGRRSSSGRSSRAAASPSSRPTRAAPRATARRSTARTSATGATARWTTSSPAWTWRHRGRPRRPRPPRRHRRLVRRLPHELDRRPARQRFKAALTCPLGRRHADAVPDRRHLRAASGRRSSSATDPWDEPEYFRLDLADLARQATMHTPLLIQHSERDLRMHRRPGGGAVHGPCARSGGRSGSCGCPTRATSSPAAATPFRRAREPRPGPRLVRALPRGGRDGLPAPPRNRAGR